MAQARRVGSRSRGTSGAGDAPATTPAAEPAEAAPHPAAAAVAAERDAELVEIMSTPIGGGHGLRLTRSLAGAAFGTLLIAGLAFGAALGPGGAFGPKDPGAIAGGAGNGAAGSGGTGGTGGTGAGDISEHHDGDASTDPGYLDGEEPDETSKPDQGGAEPAETDKPATEPGEGPGDEPDPTKQPEPKPDPKPEPQDPPADTLSLSVWIKEFHPKLEWGSCDGLDFDYYKVVRSKDSTVTWPGGENDTLIAVVEPGGYRKAYDADAPHGKKLWYRVFCVRHTEAGYKVLRASGAKGIEVPEEPAPPDTVALDLDASLDAEGHVVLDWSACNVDGFGFYKVVRSTTNENPSYMPWTDGTEVIGVVEDQYATEWYDAGGDPGQAVYYRVQCFGWINGSKVLLGETAAVAVTMP